ncbi:MAG: PD-(D/E)XK motif protein [Pseudomonadota bacterium]
MMNNFKSRWESLAPVGHSGGRYRVYPDHPLGFFLDFSAAGRREVIIEVPQAGPNNHELPPFENIELFQRPIWSGLRITLVLSDDKLINSFSVMCYDLAVRSQTAVGSAAALDIVMLALKNWSDLLKWRAAEGLTYSQAVGLLGELMVVEQFLGEGLANPLTLIRGWRGPNGDARDIGFNGTRIEVKTRHATRSVALKISSLSQLDDCGDHVHVVLNRVSPADPGVSLVVLVEGISNFLLPYPSAASEFERKLELAGFNSESPVSTRTFVLDERLVFDVRNAFPRLTPANVPLGIVSASYEIAGPILDSFRTTWEAMVEGMV